MRRLLGGLVAAVLAILVTAPSAGAADSITIRKLDVQEFPTVKISALVAGPTPELGQFTLRENGQILSGDQFEVVPIGQTDIPIGIALVIDTSGSMRTGAKLVAAKEAAKQFVAQKLPNDQIAVVAFSDQPRLISGFTNDGARLTQAIDGLTATGETALFDGVRLAATLFNDRSDLQANIVLLSDGADTVSQSNVEQAESSVLTAKAVLFAVGLRGGEFDAGSLDRLSRASGGQYTETTDANALRGLYGNVQRALQNQYEISYTSAARTGSVEVTLGAAGALTSAGPVNAGAVSEGAAAQPEVVGNSRLSGPLDGTIGLLIVAGLVALAAALLVIGVVAIVRRDNAGLSAKLAAYGPGGGSAFEATGSGDMELVQTQFVKRAVEATARLASERGVLEVVERKLEEADLPVRPAEALFFYCAGVVAFVIMGLVLNGIFGGMIAFIVFALTPIAVVNFLGRRRKKKFTEQLPDMLRLLSSSLRAGYSLLQGADAVAEQIDNPMSKELKRVLVEARLGRPLELALEDSAKRVGSKDYDWVVMAIRIQREVGGNLAELLQTVAETMVARERLRRDVDTLTAEGRVSAVVLACLPVAIGFIVFTLNRDYMRPLWEDTAGQIMLIASIVGAILGFVWMRKIIDIEI